MDLVTALALAAGAGGITVTGLASLIDLFTGDTQYNNSGEYIANSMIGAIPGGTALAGLTAEAIADPVAAKQLAVLADLGVLEQAGADMGRELAMNTQVNGAPEPDSSRGQAAVNRLKKSKEELAQEVLKAMSKNNLTSDQVLRRANRNLAIGGGLGALAGSIPAVGLMMDD